jgi:nucleoprotein TPR
VAHAGNIQRLESMEKELATAKTQLADIKAKSTAEKQGYDTREESWRDTQQHLLQQVKELEERLATLKNENASLHSMAESMTTLSNKLEQQCTLTRNFN